MVAVCQADGSLAKSSYTYQWLIERLTEKDEAFRNRAKKANVQKITYHDVGDGNGFMSFIYKIEVDFEDGSKPYSVIFKLPQPESINKVHNSLKTAAANAQCETEAIDASWMHEREVKFYERFADTDDLPIPRIFAVETRIENKRDGTVLMEDLSDKAVLCNFLKSLNVKQIINATKIVAKLAAMSLLRLSQSEVQEYDLQLPLLEGFTRVQKSAAQKAALARPELFSDIIAKLQNVIGSVEYQQYVTSGINRDLGIPAVLVHNDLHNNNIFWKKNADGSCSDEICSIIDWQTVCAGTVGHDLSALMVLTVEGNLRRQCEAWIIHYFHALLKAELQPKGTEMPFTVEQIGASYRRSFIRNALFLLVCGPVYVLKHGSQREDEEASNSRLKYALEDALKILEEELPQFL